jgi:DNA-binding NtrC family response regulator
VAAETPTGDTMPTLLAIDDQDSVLHALRRVFQNSGLTLVTAGTGAEGLEIVRRESPDVVLVDLMLPDQSGLDVFHQIREFDRRIPVIFITGEGSSDSAIDAIRHGAFDYVLKPLEVGVLRTLVARAIEVASHAGVPARLPHEVVRPGPAELLVGRSPRMQQVYSAIGKVAAQDVTVLILGESGTGKELVARAIYKHSRRATQPFLAINCAAIPETLMESELFGHEKGAFTGAERRRIGKFEQCSGGTLFLDEIGDMTPLTQSKILRVLQEQRFERVGGGETIQTDVRLIAATNRHIDRQVLTGKFRGDLYYRLNVFTIALPPLRERAEDLPLLVDHFLARFSRELGKDVTHATPEVIRLLRLYPWPGNLRELQSVLKQALLQASGPLLLPDFLPSFIRPGETLPDPAEPDLAGSWRHFVEDRLREGSVDLYAEVLTAMERDLITRVLDHTEGNQVQASKILGITRGSLRTKIRALGLTIGRSVQSEDESSGR